jgi:TPR repeat protein
MLRRHVELLAAPAGHVLTSWRRPSLAVASPAPSNTHNEPPAERNHVRLHRIASTSALALALAPLLAHAQATTSTDFATTAAQALSGDATAQYNLGVDFMNGDGVPQDDARAAFWYQKAANQGDADAELNLGFYYNHGRGVPQDSVQAAFWYQKAAEQGEIKAQRNLAMMYEDGQGVTEDYAQAMEWYRKAAAQGDVDSQFKVAYLYDHGGHGVTQDYAQAMTWYRKAAAQGDAASRTNIGAMYANGEGVTQDYAVAYLWFDLSASSRLDANDSAVLYKDRDESAAKLSQAALARVRARAWLVEHPAK